MLDYARRVRLYRVKNRVSRRRWSAGRRLEAIRLERRWRRLIQRFATKGGQ